MKYQVINSFTNQVICECPIEAFATAICDVLNEKYSKSNIYKVVRKENK